MAAGPEPGGGTRGAKSPGPGLQGGPDFTGGRIRENIREDKELTPEGPERKRS